MERRFESKLLYDKLHLTLTISLMGNFIFCAVYLARAQCSKIFKQLFKTVVFRPLVIFSYGSKFYEHLVTR